MAVDRSRLPEVGPDPAFRFPRAERHTLPNGVRVRTVEHRHAPVVSFVVQIEGGSSADPDGREGLTALTADLVDEGTGSMQALDVAEALARIAGQYDVDVGADVTHFSLTTLARFAEPGLVLLCDLIMRPSLSLADFERVRQLRLDRLRQIKDMPPALAERTLLTLLYGPHPYGHLAIGTDRALRALSLEDVRAFHAATFRPESTTIIAAGPFQHSALVRMVDERFAGWTSAPPPPASRAAPEPSNASQVARVAIVPRDGAQQSELRIAQVSTHRRTPDYSALMVMNAVLGGQFVSRVNLKLREEKGYTYGARTGFDWRRGPSPFTLQASVHTAATADAVRDAVGELAGIAGPRPVSAEELTLAKASLTRGYPRSFETVEQVARGVAQLALYDLPDDYFEEFVPRVNAVTADDVTHAAARHLKPDGMTTLIVGDLSAIGSTLDALNLGRVEVLSAEG